MFPPGGRAFTEKREPLDGEETEQRNFRHLCGARLQDRWPTSITLRCVCPSRPWLDQKEADQRQRGRQQSLWPAALASQGTPSRQHFETRPTEPPSVHVPPSLSANQCARREIRVGLHVSMAAAGSSSGIGLGNAGVGVLSALSVSTGKHTRTVGTHEKRLSRCRQNAARNISWREPKVAAS